MTKLPSLPAKAKFHKAACVAAPLFAVLMVSACKAPPSVQKRIDEIEAQKEQAKPRLVDPALTAAQQEGREFYNIFAIGGWAPAEQCASSALRWEFEAESFTPPQGRPCRLEVVEPLQDGSFAVAGYCPRVTLDDEPVVFTFTRTDVDKIILNAPPSAPERGGPLQRCPA